MESSRITRDRPSAFRHGLAVLLGLLVLAGLYALGRRDFLLFLGPLSFLMHSSVAIQLTLTPTRPHQVYASEF